MRLLRLTSSNDFVAGLPDHARTYLVAERVFRDATGVPVETTMKKFWPSPGFEAALTRWLEDTDPEMVYFIVPSYPICYESVPLRVERRLGTAGRFINARSQATASSRFGKTAAFHVLRRLSNRAIGGDPLVTVPEMAGYVERAVRLILAREGVILAIRGPKTPFGTESRAAKVRSERRRQELNRELRALCGRHHIPLQLFEEPPFEAENPAHVQADRIHMNATESVRAGEFEGQGMIAAWELAHGGSTARD